jgi:outer membrane protein assembly factor BamD (BamD/ComL family)
MKKLMYLLLLTGFIACGGEIKEGELPRAERLEVINELEDKAFSDIEKFDTTAALALVNNYARFASENPQDELTPAFLFKAGDLCMAMHKPELAIQYMDEVINNYKDFEKTPYCMFLKGFIYEDQLRDLVKAKESYEAFIKAYPDHEMTDAAKFSIKNLGKSPEELIQEFEEKNDSTQVES